ncbi:MAG: TylF/MycF family methyltransferase [Acidobacteria bacterium]|nr:TylF/MycF family methyltransferase [Acidobacteriota bacterium]
MRKIIARTINKALKPAGLRVSRAGGAGAGGGGGLVAGHVNAGNYMKLLEEVQGIFSELVFPSLPPREHRTRLLAELLGTGISEAMYLLNYLHESVRYEGDVCEFGVAQGATSALLANEIYPTGKNIWLFDSFQGLPKPSEKDQLIDDIFDLKTMKNYEGTMSCPLDMVEGRLKAISFPPERVRIVPGFIEETIRNPPLPERVCFAYIDFDFYNPILVALNFLDQRLPVGGAVVVDDYGFFSSGAKTAVDEFAGEHRDTYEVIHPPKFAGHFCILRRNG